MTGLFLRYCWRCNSTQTAVTKGACTGCGEKVAVIDAHALIPMLAANLTETQRQAALARVQAHDRSEGT